MTARPGSIAALQEVVARTSPASLRVTGAGTKRPADATDDPAGTVVLDTRSLTGHTPYDPAECVVTVLAGTPVAEVAAMLRPHGQYLPWDPPWVREGATIGGMVASGLSGSGRLRYGGVRDFVIGARVVDGRGRLVASGGKVVKNAAGFLTHHVLVGSAGRLGVIAEVSFKVFPSPEATCTVMARAASRAGALAAHDRLHRANADLDALDIDVGTSTVMARLAGAAAALPARTDRAVRALALPADVLTGEAEAAAWDGAAPAATRTVVKVPATPSRLPVLLDALAPLGPCRTAVGGAVVYVQAEGHLAAIDTALRALAAAGMVVSGAGHGRALGVATTTAFHARVRHTLDPDARFC